MSVKEHYPQQEYQAHLDQYSSAAAKLNKLIGSVSNLRLVIFVAMVAGAVLFFRMERYTLFVIDLLAGFAVFVAVVWWHNLLHLRHDNIKEKIRINEAGLLRIKGEWGSFKDCGDDFIDHEHPYSWDLDIFGKNSVFQWTSVCRSYTGRKLFAEQLTNPELSVPSIIQKQSAVRELAGLLDWRQELELNGAFSDIGRNPENFLLWSESDDSTFKSQTSICLFRLLPWISFGIGSVGFILTKTLLFFAAVYALQFALYGIFHAKTIKVFEIFEKNGRLLLAYSRLVKTIERGDFKSEYLSNNKKNLVTSDRHSASRVFQSLSKILAACEVRYSPMAHSVANAVLLWDFQCIINADRLKKHFGKQFRTWIETIGRFEALSSLANIAFENPQWVFPSFSSVDLQLEVKTVGHPLLHHSVRITNDYPLQTSGTVAIITGSNMSGKSTFLRTVGTNLVLAYCGAPVCAQMFTCSPVEIYSSMRVNDDLSSKISTFYAELLRIKKMVQAVKSGQKILFLLDELFRGTNSQDRHDGAVEVLHALTNDNTMGVISTHDLQLCDLADKDKSRFFNYHFSEQYDGNTITFDYKLKRGRSTTKNAMFLLKMIGIGS